MLTIDPVTKTAYETEKCPRDRHLHINHTVGALYRGVFRRMFVDAKQQIESLLPHARVAYNEEKGWLDSQFSFTVSNINDIEYSGISRTLDEWNEKFMEWNKEK